MCGTIIKMEIYCFRILTVALLRDATVIVSKEAICIFRILIMSEHDARDPHQRTQDNRIKLVLYSVIMCVRRKSPGLRFGSHRLEAVIFRRPYATTTDYSYVGILNGIQFRRSTKPSNQMPKFIVMRTKNRVFESVVGSIRIFINRFKSAAKVCSVRVILFKSIGEPTDAM